MLLAGYLLSFLVIGLWLALKAHKKKLLPNEFIYIASLATSLLMHYFLFYLYLLSPWLAHQIVLLIILISPVLLVFIVQGCLKSPAQLTFLRKYYLPPLVISSLLLIIFSSLFYSCFSRPPALGGYQDIDNRTFCHISTLPFDNALPFIYADNILRNEDKKLAIDWKLVDRPPLQIAATLPIEDLSMQDRSYVRFSYYHIFSVFLQLSWVGAVWAILQRLKIKKRAQACLFVGFSTTGFFYLNSVFVWPKLLAAGLAVAGISLFIGNTKRKLPYNYLPFAAILISLGLLSHAGVLFSIVPFGALLLYKIIRSSKINYRYVVASILLALFILVPWQLYKGAQPNPDRLVKYHFAGITAYDDMRGTLQTIVDQYKTLSLEQWEHAKTQNAETLVTGSYNLQKDCPIKLSTILSDCNMSQWRALTFFSTFFALEVFTVGFIVLLYQLVRRRLDSFDKDTIFIIVAGLVFWIFSMFLPGSTVVHQGSYASMVLMFVLLGKHMAKLRLPILIFLTCLQVVIFYFVWIHAFHIPELNPLRLIT